MVSVPWVITKPSTSGDFASSLMRLASVSRIAKLMSCDPTLEICSPFKLARSVIPGTAAIITSMPTAPDVYPSCVPVAAAPAIVPPGARITTFDFLAACASATWRCTARAMMAIAIASDVLRVTCMVRAPVECSRSLLALPILALVEMGQLHRIQQIGDLRLGQQMLLPDNLEDSFAAPVRLAGELGGFVISEHGVECGHDAHRRFHVVLEHLLVDGDPIHAAFAQRDRRVVEQVLRLEHRDAHERLVRVELQLPGVGREGDAIVVAHHPERDEVDELGNDGI